MLAWLLGAAVGPAAVALPVNWAADALAGVAQRWFRRLRHTDDLSRLVRAASGTSVDISRAEFDAVRRLLEDKETWALLGHGTVDDLADRIASCLQARDGRAAGDLRVAALTIARGLLEFAVADLDPKLFQQVLLARLDRMETGQASALDEALLGLHADLAARFTDVMEQFKRVLDRLPPGAADRGEVAVYLSTLIDWVNTDPWPRDRRFSGPVLTPSAIERKLRVASGGEQGLDADDLARQCQRLVILGGPGSGKTWLAKRAARRCAEAALQALEAGAGLDEVELPLYTTCAGLFGAPGDIRQAAVSSALDQLGDLGGSRISAALRLSFAERGKQTVLVIDSLDEAHGSDERLWQADTLPWRIILTSRPSSWNGQFDVEDGDESRRVGELRPLRYPDDVEPFIERWFTHQPALGEALAAEIAQRPGFQQAATVPLILAFYCIVGGSDPLPEFRRDLYAKVINRLLTGRWRGSSDGQVDVRKCLQVLQAWARSGATSHPVSGVGTWGEDAPTEGSSAEGSRLSEAEDHALDHIAAPVGPPDVDTGTVFRRFIHRSIREHLVAEHIAGLPVDQAADELLPHLWYDSDWEYVAPAALARHPSRDQLLRDLICRAANSDDIPANLSAFDAGWEFRGLLARVASESSEADWQGESAQLIGNAREQLARTIGRTYTFGGYSRPIAGPARTSELGRAAHWPNSNRRVRGALIDMLEAVTYSGVGAELVAAIVQLRCTAEDDRQARAALLRLLISKTDAETAAMMARGMARLVPTAEEERQARDALLALLPSQTRGDTAADLVSAVAELVPTAEEERQAREALLGLLTDETDASAAIDVVSQVILLARKGAQESQVRQALLGSLASLTSDIAAWVARRDPAAEGEDAVDEGFLAYIAGQSSMVAYPLAVGLAELDPAPEETLQAREALLQLLAAQTDVWAATALAKSLITLGPATEEMCQAREALLRLVTSQTDGGGVGDLIGVIAELAPTGGETRQVRETLVGFLRSPGRRDDGWVDYDLLREVVNGLIQLAPTAEGKHQACEGLLHALAGAPRQFPAPPLVRGVVQLTRTAEDKCQAREALLALLASQTDAEAAAALADGVAQLAPTAEDTRKAREALLNLLVNPADMGEVIALVGGVAQLAPTAEEAREIREPLLEWLPEMTDAEVAVDLATCIAQLAPASQDLRQAREVLLGFLARGVGYADWLVRAVVQLAPTAEDKRQAREALLRLLAGGVSGGTAPTLVGGVVQLAPTVDDKRQARGALLRLLAEVTDHSWAYQLADALIQLDPAIHDLSAYPTWATLPTVELLTVVRQNTALADWLAGLPSLTSLSVLPA